MAELATERQAVKRAVEAMGHVAWLFEIDAGAQPVTPQQAYLREVKDSDIYLGIFWKGYGGYTVEELEHALDLGKACLIYEKRTGLDQRESKLQTFLDRLGQVETGLTIKWFETPEELEKQIEQDIKALLAWAGSYDGSGLLRPFQLEALVRKYKGLVTGNIRKQRPDELCFTGG